MSYRSVKFVPALLAGIVAGANLAAVTDLRAQSTEQGAEAGTQVAQAAESCLSAPKGATPSGSHWYYRIDRTTKRKCWYLREESEKADDKFARAAPPESAPASSSAEAPQPQTATRKSFDDARAEWVAQQARAEPNRPAKAEPQTADAAPAPADQNGQRAAMPNVLAPAPLATMRWNDAPAASASTNPASLQVAAAGTPANQPPQANEVQQPAADQVAPAAAAAEPAKPTASLQMLLLVMAAALALAGLTVSAIVRIGRMRARRAMRHKRRAMWDSARTKRPSPPVFHAEDARLQRAGLGAVQHTRVPKERPRVPQERAHVPQERARAPQERVRVPQERARVPQEQDQQVTEMLARLARSAQT
ncbi:hypothetical protein [Bradyrhizobium australiense]|uniref:Uncharacterized protein n=1 Tax=Bradyrhizobium australiense TaxID=2721161 RepID=A0A7Y4LW15_9BRAD|nr:hypothetical protein [Bradyrhizobium australiense]NOJ40711.1 hypothetical protein [Bradyrhizobium australiense]